MFSDQEIKPYVMKHIFLIALAIVAFSACSDSDDEFEGDRDRLEGYWSLTDITGGIAGTGYEASFDHLQFNDDDRYALMVHDAVIQEGKYILRKEDEQLFILFTPVSTNNIFFHDFEKRVVFGDQDTTLVLSDPCCDLYVYSFEKEGK